MALLERLFGTRKQRAPGVCLQLHPLPVALRRLHHRLDEGEAFDAVVDGWKLDALRRLFAVPRRLDSGCDFGIDVGEALEIAFRVARWNAGHPRGRFARVRPAAGDDARGFLKWRPGEIIRIVLPPVDAAFRPIDAQHESVLVAGRDLARP